MIWMPKAAHHLVMLLLFSEQDMNDYRSGENPPFPAVSMLFTDHADGSISGDLLGWAMLDNPIFQTFPTGQFLYGDGTSGSGCH